MRSNSAAGMEAVPRAPSRAIAARPIPAQVVAVAVVWQLLFFATPGLLASFSPCRAYAHPQLPSNPPAQPPDSPSRRPARQPDIYFAPTSHAVADAMLVLARVGPDDVVYDLGSGDGRIVVIAAQKYGARGVGIELDPALVERSRQIAREGEVSDRVTFREGDLFTEDIGAATVVTLYLSPSVNVRLEGKLRRELRPGTRIVSHQFVIGRWPPDATAPAADGTTLYLWIVRGEHRLQ